MAEKDIFAERGRSLEDQYFQKREKELLERLQRKADAEAEKRRLGEAAGVADPAIIADLQALGHTPETMMLLHLVPLVHMAWADGKISPRERELIVQAARMRGVQPDSAADRQLAGWLAERPAPERFERALRAIKAVLHGQSAQDRDASQKDLLSYLTSIASASGGVMGFRAVSSDERQLLKRITEELEKAHGPAAARDDVLPPKT